MWKIHDLYFIPLRKKLKIQTFLEGWKCSRKEDERERYGLLVLWFSGSLWSVRWWVGQDILKSQKKSIFKTLSKEGFVNCALSELPSACISSLFIWFYSCTWASRIPAPPTHPRVPSQSLLLSTWNSSFPRVEGGTRQGWGQKKLLPWPGTYPHNSQGCTQCYNYKDMKESNNQNGRQ